MSLSKSHHFKSWFSKHWLYSHNVFFYYYYYCDSFKKQNKCFTTHEVLSSRPPLSLCFLCFPFTASILSHDQKWKQRIHVQVSVRQRKMSLQFTTVGGIPSVEHVVVVCHRRRSPGYAYTAHLHLCSAERTCKQN